MLLVCLVGCYICLGFDLGWWFTCCWGDLWVVSAVNCLLVGCVSCLFDFWWLTLDSCCLALLMLIVACWC